MAYKFSKGSQKIGDLKSKDDSNGDTLIDLGDDEIAFETSGSVRAVINNSGVSVAGGTLDVSGNVKLDSSVGRIGVGMHLGGLTDGGATPAYVAEGNTPNYRIHVIGDATNGAAFATETYANATGGPKFRFIKGRGTPASPSAINANDEVGRIEFYSHTGSNTMKLSAMIACFADADGDGKLSFRSTHNGVDNEAFYLHDNRVYFADQVRIGNVIAPTTNGGTNIGGAGARFEEIHGNKLIGYDSVKIDNTTAFGQSGYGVTFGIDYVPHTDVGGNDAGSSHMSALTYASTNTATRNVAFNLIKTGSHTAGLGTYGTGNSNEKVVIFGQYNTTAFEFRNNVGVEPLLIQSGSLLMTLSAAGDLGIGTSAPIAKLDVAGKMAISSESNTPAQPADGKGYLYSKSDGKLYWRSHDIVETDLTSGGGEAIVTINSLTGATGDVQHDCTDSKFFYHTNISGNFTPDFTQLNMQNNQVVESRLILTQGGTGYLPSAFKVDNTGSATYWEGSATPSASSNGTDTIDLKITKISNNYSVFARYSRTVYVSPPGVFSIPNNAVLFLDASDDASYDGSGNSWTDLSGQGNHATLVNSPSFSNSDKWFDFTGGSSHHATLPSGFADFTNGATFFFVADLDSGDNWERLIDFSSGGTPINIGRNSSGTSLTLEYYNPSKTATTSNIIQNNTLASYCVTTDGTNAKFYRNGSLITTNSFNKVPDNSARSQNYIGRSRNGADAYFDGQIAVVGIFNRDLSASEIAELHDHYDTIYSL